MAGGDRSTNAAIAKAVLEGERGPRPDIVLMKAAAALVVAGKATSLLDGMSLATASVDSGAAMGKLQSLRSHSWDTL